MALSEKILTELTARCQPDEPLTHDDQRNIDVDKAPLGVLGPRGQGWAHRLKKIITRSEHASAFILFSGLRGSGKSTELLRLADLLAEDGYLPAIANAEDRVVLHAPIDVPDLLLPLLYETEEEVLRVEKRDPALAMREGAVRRLWNWVTRTDVELNRVEGGLDYGWDHDRKASLKLVLDLKNRPSLRERVRRTVSTHLTAFLAEIAEAFCELDARARRVRPRGLVVILDSLEKIQGTNDQGAVLASALQLFAGDAPYLRLPVHALYTVPPALILRLQAGVEFIPMIKLHDRSGRPHAPGYEVLRRMIEARIKREWLVELLGPTSVDARVERIIAASGGYPRALVQLLREILNSADAEVSALPFDDVLLRARDSLRRIVRFEGSAIDWLAGVAERHELIAETEEQQAAALRMLDLNVVLRYLNQEEWWEVHPWVRDMPEIVAAQKRLRAVP